MPTIKEQIGLINNRLDTLETALRLRQTPEKKAWIASKWDLMVQYKGTGLVLAVFLSVAGIYGKYYLDHKDDNFNAGVDNRIGMELGKPDGVMKKLESIQATVTTTEASLNSLKPFIQDLVALEMNKSASLPRAELQKALPFVRNTVAVAHSQNLVVPEKTIKALADSLSKLDDKAPDFWPTSMEFISYRSQVISPNPKELALSLIPDCVETTPTPGTVTSVQRSPGNDTYMATIKNPEYTNCRLTLDSQKDASKINEVIKHALRITFKNCLIVYSGGPIEITLERNHVRGAVMQMNPKDGIVTSAGLTEISGPTMEFTDCRFEFKSDANVNPSKFDLEFTEQILRQSGPTIELSAFTPRS